MAVAIPKHRIKFGPEGPLRMYETFSGSLKKKKHSTDEQSKKCGARREVEDALQAKKKQTTPPDLRTALAKAQFILKAKHKNVPDKNNNKSYLLRLLMEKEEEMERTLCEEKARIDAEIREIAAAKIAAARMRAQTELKQQRERQRIELEEMKPSFYFEENHHHREMEKEVFGCSTLTEIRLLFAKYTGLTLKNDEGFEEMEDLEEGEII